MNKTIKKIWIFSGEASGDIYGARLATELQKEAAQRGETVKISGMGGPKMRAAGVDILVDSTELGVIGVIEIVKHLFTFVRIFFKLIKLAEEERPDRVVVIDYPTFNLMFAKQMYKRHIPVIWYVSPHVWTWGKNRIPKLAKYCLEVLVIFPFEEDFYAQNKVKAKFVGHPLIDIVRERTVLDLKRDENLFLLLPGSRSMEVNRLLKPMLDCAVQLHQKYPDLKFAIAAPRQKIYKLCEDIVQKYLTKHHLADFPITISSEATAVYQQKAATGLAASGTVTVESAIAGLPLIVVYRLNWITILLAAMVVKLYRGFFTMVNIIVNREVFPEFLQHHVNTKELLPAIEKIMPHGAERKKIEDGMAEMRRLLGAEANLDASARAAQAVWDTFD